MYSDSFSYLLSLLFLILSSLCFSKRIWSRCNCRLIRYFTKMLLLRVSIFSYESTYFFSLLNFYRNAFSLYLYIIKKLFSSTEESSKIKDSHHGRFSDTEKSIDFVSFLPEAISSCGRNH